MSETETFEKQFDPTISFAMPFDDKEMRARIEGWGCPKGPPDLSLTKPGETPLWERYNWGEEGPGDASEEILPLPGPQVTGRYRLVKEEDNIPPAASDKQVFDSGAQRDPEDGKLLYVEIPHQALRREAEILTRGAERYGRGNFRKGIPFSRTMSSLLRHVMAYWQGDRSEDHLAQARANLSFLIYFEEMIKEGKLPKELDDLDGNDERYADV